MGFRVYSSTIEACCLGAESIRRCFEGVQAGSVCGVVFCGTSSEVEYHQLLAALKRSVYELLGRGVPVTLIPQYLLPEG